MNNDPNTGGDSKAAEDIFPPKDRRCEKHNMWLSAGEYCQHCFPPDMVPPYGMLPSTISGRLPTDAKTRKESPMATGLLDYFPKALAAVANCSKVGNDQHNPGQPMHWAREKSTDHADCIIRHLIDRGTVDTDGVRHAAKVAWRALALLELELEKESA